MQTCPAFSILPTMMRSIASLRSAVSEITVGDFPPSSSVTGTRFFEAAAMMWRATLVAPVNTMWSKASEENACPTSGPPVTTAISAGSKILPTISSMSWEVAGVNSDGLIIARLPAAMTPASGSNTIPSGKFQGAMTPTTPLGWYWMDDRPPRRPSGNIEGRFSAFIHFRRCFLACFRFSREPVTSVIRFTCLGRHPKSAFMASLIFSALATSTSIVRSSLSMRVSADTSPSAR